MYQFTKLKNVEHKEFELIIVNNNSKDGTNIVIEKYADILPIRYFFEEKQGKTFALNKGLSQAKGEFVVFVDDDVFVEPNWLAAYGNAANKYKEYAWFGGPVFPYWTNSKPKWLRMNTPSPLASYFTFYDLGRESRPYICADKLPIGASMGLRKDVFVKIGGFREDLGPRGKVRGVGDDTELLVRANAAGFRGYYIAEAVCWHYVDPVRFSMSEYLRYGFGRGLNQFQQGVGGDKGGSWARVAGQTSGGLYQLLKSRGDRFRICLINVGIEMGRMKAKRNHQRDRKRHSISRCA
jgi:glycosyltransferase involved in cell wall biosynthesis